MACDHRELPIVDHADDLVFDRIAFVVGDIADAHPGRPPTPGNKHEATRAGLQSTGGVTRCARSASRVRGARRLCRTCPASERRASPSHSHRGPDWWAPTGTPADVLNKL